MTIAAILDKKGRDVVTLAASASVRDAVTLLADRRIGATVMLDNGGGIAGILSERDVIAALCRNDHEVLGIPAQQIMSSPAVTVTSETGVLPSLALMSRKRIRHLPVVDGDELVGLVSIGDLVQYRIENMTAEAEAMREYIQAV